MFLRMPVSICFIVPSGLEDIAREEIAEKLVQYPRLPPASKWITFPGLVQCSFQTSGLDINTKTDLCTQVREIQFFSVEKMFLVVASLDVSKDEFQAKPADSTSGKIPWIEWLASCITNCALESWIGAARILNAAGFCPGESSPEEILFRATFLRGDFKHPIANSQTMAGALGASILSVSSNAKVKLENFEIEVLGCLIPGGSFAQLLLGFSLESYSAKAKPISWRHRVISGRTSLRPTIAYCIARMANIQPGQVVLDPCCGVGTIPIEASLTCQPLAHFICGDIELDSIHNKANINITAAAPYSASVVAWNAKALPIRDQLVDIVITDLPWGMREGSFNMCAKLYPKLMKQLIRVVKKGSGKAYILTLDHKLLKHTLNTPWCQNAWKVCFVRDIRIGYQVKLFCLERTED
ncbi:hypothetical protein DSO57_1016508 [Entomophthora muscae]|uniref:Uncharacterized protein n=3 Tax=Entomophthora muscae TaxID=34485 RepID=A0ACC2UEA9_9FUNG|nr:hypothetical protein DSO57_1016508 [Entomophthora muscae]